MKKMKIVFFVGLMTLLGLSQRVVAQEEPRPNFWFGIKAGTEVHINETIDLPYELGNNLKVGAFAQFGRRLFFQPELYYAWFVPEAGDRISSIKAPVALGLQLIDIGLLSLNIKGGGMFSKELREGSPVDYRWQAGVGVNVMGFITTDFKYTFIGGEEALDQLGNLLDQGGVLTVTVGFRFR